MPWSGDTWEEVYARVEKEMRLSNYPPSDYCRLFMDDSPFPKNIEDHFLQDQPGLTQVLVEYGLSYKVLRGSYAEFCRFKADYDITYSPGEGWISGSHLLSRWEMTARDLISVHRGFPVYLRSKTTASMELINREISFYSDIMTFQEDPHMWIEKDKKPAPNIWFCIPQLWQCKTEHIEFYEKMEHEQARKMPDKFRFISNAAELEVTLDWLSVTEVKDRWSISNYKLEELVSDKGLPSYGLDADRGIYLIDADAPTMGIFGGPLFRLAEMQLFEDEQAKKKRDKRLVPSINEHRRDRLLARDLARPLIRKDPLIRSGAVVKELKKDPRLKHIHRDETLRGYIADLILNRKSGSNKGPRGTYHKYTK